MKAVQSLTNVFSIEIEVVDSDSIKYKYSNEKDWTTTTIEFLIKEDDNEEDADYVPAFKTEEGTIYYIDEFITTDN